MRDQKSTLQIKLRNKRRRDMLNKIRNQSTFAKTLTDDDSFS
jgi:hypothetical protein